MAQGEEAGPSLGPTVRPPAGHPRCYTMYFLHQAPVMLARRPNPHLRQLSGLHHRPRRIECQRALLRVLRQSRHQKTTRGRLLQTYPLMTRQTGSFVGFGSGRTHRRHHCFALLGVVLPLSRRYQWARWKRQARSENPTVRTPDART